MKINIYTGKNYKKQTTKQLKRPHVPHVLSARNARQKHPSLLFPKKEAKTSE